MALLVWNAKYSMNITMIDEQHQKLIGVINKLSDALNQGKGATVLVQIIEELTAYKDYHFNTEENLMQQLGYPDFSAHKAEHDKFKVEVAKFQEDLKKGKVMVSIAVINFLIDWLDKHILETDKKYSKFFNDKGLF